MTRVVLIASTVVLLGMVLWWAFEAPVRPPRHPAESPHGFTLPTTLGGGGAFSSDGSSTASAKLRSTGPELGAGGPLILRAAEPETYTALPGDGPVSESGPGDVTHPYPPSRVTYVSKAEMSGGGAETPAEAPSDANRTGSPPPPPEPDDEKPKQPARTLDKAIEGSLGEPAKSDGAPGEYR